jgi:hypothetical protein
VAARPAAGGQAVRLSTDGTTSNGYHAGSIVWSADSATVSAYRVSAEVWTSGSVSGNVKKLVVKGQWATPH